MLSSKDYIRGVTLVHVVMLLSQIILLAFSIWEIAPSREKENDIHYIIIITLIFLVSLVLSYKITIGYIEKGTRKRGMREKLICYKKGLYIQWSFLEFMSLSAIIAYLMTGEKLFIFATGFSIILFIICRPTIKRTIIDLDLDKSEARILETPDAAL